MTAILLYGLAEISASRGRLVLARGDDLDAYAPGASASERDILFTGDYRMSVWADERPRKPAASGRPSASSYRAPAPRGEGS